MKRWKNLDSFAIDAIIRTRIRDGNNLASLELGRYVPMKKQSLIFVLVLLTLLGVGCRGAEAPAAPEEGVAIATFTSTPLIDLDAVAAQTHTATITETPTLTLVPSETVTVTQPEATATVPTATATVLTATATVPEMTATQPTETASAAATLTPTPEVAEANAPESVNAEIPEGGRYFVIQEGAPIGMPNWAHQEEGCNWLGVAGQVFDLNGDPIMDLIVEAGGTLDGQPMLGLSLTGVATAYGPGGYEIQLADHVIASHGTVWLQIKNDAGDLFSGNIYIERFADCAANLLLLNFVEVEEIPDFEQVFLPLIIHQDSD